MELYGTEKLDISGFDQHTRYINVENQPIIVRKLTI